MRGRRMSRTMMPAGPSPSISPAIAARGESPAGPTMSESDAERDDQRRQGRDRAARHVGSAACMLSSSGRPSYRVPACGGTGLRGMTPGMTE